MHSVSKHMRVSELSTKIRMKIDLYLPRQRYSPMTVVSGNVRLARIFAGFPTPTTVGKGKHGFSGISTLYVFGAFKNETNVSIL